MLARAIGGEARHGAEAPDRRLIDDAAAVVQQGQQCTGQADHADHIVVELRLPALVGRSSLIGNRRGQFDAGVIDQYVDRHAVGSQPIGATRHLGVVAQVDTEGTDLFQLHTLRRRQLQGHCLQRSRIAVEQDQMRALSGERLGQGAANAAGGATDDHTAAGIIERMHAQTAVRNETPTAP